jgi:peptidoglycan/LPS O-acetylase OafA/YrhL
MSIDRAVVATSTTHRYLALDALRGVAAFAVLFYHLRNLYNPEGPTQATSWFASGYLAVDLFFLLSGFVIAHAYGDRLGTALSFKGFMVARLIRLQPVIAIATLLGFAVALASRLLGLPDAPGLFAIATSLPLNLLMMPNPLVPWGIFLFNPPAWSLFYELVANAAYGIAACRIARKQTIGRGSFVGKPIALAAITTSGLVGLVASAAMLGSLDHGVVLADWPVAMARIAFSFTAGLLLHRTRLSWMPVMPRIPIFVLLPTCLVLLAIAPSGIARSVYDVTFVVLLSPLLVMVTAGINLRPGWVSAATWLGMLSYPLYAIHAPIKHLAGLVLSDDFDILLAVTSCSAVLTAWLVGALIDPALRRWLGTQLGSPAPSPARSTNAATGMA